MTSHHDDTPDTPDTPDTLDTPVIDPERVARGAEVFQQVYAGIVPLPPAGYLDFADLMLSQLFAEQWSRPQLATRDRRLVTLAAVASTGAADAWAIHLEAALLNEEITPVEAREILIHLAQYLGYPRVQALVRMTEEIIGRVGTSGAGTVDS